MGLLVFFLLATIAVSFLCSILEATLMSVPVSYVAVRQDEGYKPAGKMMKYKQDPSRPIAAILSLNTIANTAGAAGVGAQAAKVAELYGLSNSAFVGVVSAVFTVLILIFSEIIPKTIGTTHCRSMLGFATKSIRVLIFVLYPIVIAVEYLQKLIAPKSDEAAISREEVGAMADVAEESGELDEDENEIIQNLINIDDISVTESMTPRVVAEIASENMTVKSFCKDRRFYHHSRIPVYADNDEYITGYILRVEALQLMAEDKFDVKLHDIKREVECFSEEASIGEVWPKMLDKNEQIAIIIDEYGSFQGILTMEDVIETILGDEIVDERDAVVDMQQLAKEKWQKRALRQAAKNTGTKKAE